MGSNAWAIGPDRTEDGTTMIVGNPHFPWEGALRFYEVHLTIPGELDVYGASLLGSPAVNIGFTEGVAWSHTVSAGKRFTVYSLTLDPDDPTRYVYGDDTRDMTSETVTIDVLADDGSTSPVERTIWFSHYGPVLNFPGVGWSDSTVLTFRDANADNDELIPQFAAMNRAQTMDELIQAHADNQGIPWVNTIAASADGRIWYADTSSSPNLSDAAIAQWEAAVAAGGFAKVALDNGVILLDGSDPVNEWVDDPAARDPGVVPFDAMPQLERTDFVFNANDPYWIANPDEPLLGFSPVHGLDESPLSTRTRGNAAQLAVDTGMPATTVCSRGSSSATRASATVRSPPRRSSTRSSPAAAPRSPSRRSATCSTGGIAASTSTRWVLPCGAPSCSSTRSPTPSTPARCGRTRSTRPIRSAPRTA
jgi:acyl-homoserine-lactone acylase